MFYEDDMIENMHSIVKEVRRMETMEQRKTIEGQKASWARGVFND